MSLWVGVSTRHRLVAAQQAHDDVEVHVHQLARVRRAEADHGRVGRQRPGADAEHRAPARQVVEQDHALGHPQRVVVGQRGDAGAELDVARALGGGGDEDLGRGDDLAAGRVVLADPRLVVAEAVEVLDQLEVALERQRRVLARRVERRHEDAEAQPAHRTLLLRSLTHRAYAPGAPPCRSWRGLSRRPARGSAGARPRESAPRRRRRRRTGAAGPHAGIAVERPRRTPLISAVLGVAREDGRAAVAAEDLLRSRPRASIRAAAPRRCTMRSDPGARRPSPRPPEPVRCWQRVQWQ